MTVSLILKDKDRVKEAVEAQEKNNINAIENAIKNP